MGPASQPRPGKQDAGSNLAAWLVIIILVLVAGAVVVLVLRRHGSSQSGLDAQSYEQCVKQGNYVRQSQPPVCFLTDGRSFTGPSPASPSPSGQPPAAPQPPSEGRTP